MKSDIEEEKKKKINKTLEWLASQGFSKTVDEIGMATIGAPLYYKEITDNGFIIITMFGLEYNILQQGFDVFYCPNAVKENMGKILYEVDPNFHILSFDLARDINKLNDFILSKKRNI